MSAFAKLEWFAFRSLWSSADSRRRLGKEVEIFSCRNSWRFLCWFVKTANPSLWRDGRAMPKGDQLTVCMSAWAASPLVRLDLDSEDPW